jgi:CPA2 family monovalent cation:H+ antiporter-2
MAGVALDLREAVVVLAAAGLVVPVMHRLKVSPVLGFLAVGMAIGPHALGRVGADVPVLGWLTIHDPALVRLAGELGVVALLFMIGLELSLERLRRLARLVFGLGGAQVGVTGALIAAVAYAFGNSVEAAIVLGACLALSSTAVVMQLLTETRRIGTPAGQTSFAVLLFQDLAVVPILFVVGALGAGGGAGSAIALGIGLALVKAAVAIVAILVAGRLVLRPFLRLVANTESREFFFAAVLLTIAGIGSATEAAGLSLALGAFLAGLLLAETEFRHRVAVDIEPFKGLLLGIFFVAVGLGIDLGAVLAEPLLLPLSALGLIVLKAAVFAALALAFGVPRAVAVETAILTAQGGEFAFVVIGLAAASGLVPPATAQFMLLTVGLTMAATPALARLARIAGERLAPAPAPAAVAPVTIAGELAGHVVVVGYGRVGRAVGALLDRQSVPHVAIEARADRVAALAREGIAVFQGDAARNEILERLGIARAAALVVTMDDPALAARVVAAARKNHPGLPIHARVRDDEHALELLAAGATDVVPETTEASLQLGEAVLIGVGVPEDAARDLVADQRALARAALERRRD